MNRKQFEQMSEDEKEALAGEAMLKMLEVPDLLKGLIATISAQTHAINALAASNEELANALLQDLRDAQEENSVRPPSTLDED